MASKIGLPWQQFIPDSKTIYRIASDNKMLLWDTCHRTGFLTNQKQEVVFMNSSNLALRNCGENKMENIYFNGNSSFIKHLFVQHGF